MAITVTDIEDRCSVYLKRARADPRPWTDAEVAVCVNDTLSQLWPDFGILVNADGTSDAGQVIPVPSAFGSTWRISRIFVKNSAGRVADKAQGFLPHPGNFVFLKTPAGSGSIYSFYGFTPYLTDASNIPDRFLGPLGMRAAGFAWGMLAAELANSELQQTLDNGRVVTEQQALTESAYFERRWQDAMEREPTRISVAPRLANRTR